MTLSGVNGAAAGFALATAGLGSAVVLNLIFWLALIVSIPIRGVNAGYAVAAVIGIVLMLRVGVTVLSLLDGQGRAERVVRWAARHLRLSEDRATAGVRHIGVRLEELVGDRRLLVRVLGWAAANWLLGGVLYGTLRVGPWSIKRRDPLRRLRDIATDPSSNERALDFSVRFSRKRP